VLRAFNGVSYDKAFGEVGIAVGAISVSSEELVLMVAAKDVSLLTMVETDYVGQAKICSVTSLGPTVTVRFRVKGTNTCF
jgi:hypothetical protein